MFKMKALHKKNKKKTEIHFEDISSICRHSNLTFTHNEGSIVESTFIASSNSVSGCEIVARNTSVCETTTKGSRPK